jgi:colanic acid biosynthesis glycosyl transferase WcaI
MGDPFVGIVHPCKVYNVLSLGIPFLFVGPPDSHVGDLAKRLNEAGYARMARHADIESVCHHIREAAAMGTLPPNEKAKSIGAEFAQSRICPRLVKLVEDVATS